jgi:hypothetical protein
MKKNQFLNFRKGRLPVKIDQFLKGKIVHENRPVFKIQKGQVACGNISVSEKEGHP